MRTGDAIDRQAAIDAMHQYSHFDDFDISVIDEEIAVIAIKDLPSVQPEIIRCKDCKYHTHMWYCEAWNNSPGFPAVSDDMFCSLAERREE